MSIHEIQHLNTQMRPVCTYREVILLACILPTPITVFFHVWAGENSSPLDSLKGLWKEEMFALWIAFYELCLFRILVTTVLFCYTTMSHLMTDKLTLYSTPWLNVQTLSNTPSPYRHGNTETLKTSNKPSIIPTMLANFYQFFLILCLGLILEGFRPLDFPLNFELMCSYASAFLFGFRIYFC